MGILSTVWGWACPVPEPGNQELFVPVADFATSQALCRLMHPLTPTLPTLQPTV